MSNSLEIKFVPKGWGFEKWIVNKEEYCGKLLYFVKGKKMFLALSQNKRRSILYSIWKNEGILLRLRQS